MITPSKDMTDLDIAILRAEEGLDYFNQASHWLWSYGRYESTHDASRELWAAIDQAKKAIAAMKEARK